MNLPEMLRITEAPEALIAWAPESVEEGFETCPSGVWLVWVAGSSGFPLDLLIRCTLALVDDFLGAFGEEFEGRDLLLDALDIAQDCLEGEASTEECLEVAEECELMANEPPASYRAVAPPGFVDLCRAVSWIPKAVEGYESSRVRIEVPHVDRAQQMGSLLGAGAHIFLPAEQVIAIDPAKVPNDEVQASMVYVVAALGEALGALEHAKNALTQAPDEEGLKHSARWAAERLRAIAREKQ